MAEISKINLDDPRCNMFGILPCPKCGGAFRWPTQATHFKYPDSIVCDGCGFIEPNAYEEEIPPPVERAASETKGEQP